MGCDIHAFVEEKGIQTDVWEYSDNYAIERYEENDRVYEYPKGYRMLDGKLGSTFIDLARFPTNRNYSFFAILAGVRNGRGFAGKPTGEGFIPISKPRGLPNNVSPQVRAYSDRWGVDGHSHSWLTIRELWDYDWTRVTSLYTEVPQSVHKFYELYGRFPHDDDYDFSEKRVPLRYEITYAEAVGENILSRIYTMTAYPDQTRVVFWFDN